MNPVTDGPQQLMRLWGEEQEDGVIYVVYLKKVRYHPRITKQEAAAVAHLEWETVRVKIVKAGTLEKLVENLATDTGELESTYINIFLSTYRSFATPSQVMTLLLDRYSQIIENKITMDDRSKDLHKITIGRVLLVWIDVFSEDFFDPPQFLLLHQVLEFTKQFLPSSMLEKKAKQRLEKFQKCGFNEPNSSLLSSFFNLSLHSSIFLHLNFLDIPDRHFAEQLTYIDAALFKELIPHHCLGSMWSQREKNNVWKVKPFTVTATINQFNAVSLRVMSTILSDPSLKSILRAKIILKWIDVAQELRFLKNFSSLKAITAALQSNPIYRLKKVWTMVPNSKTTTFSELAQIFSEDNNQINCRSLLIKEGSAKFADTIACNDKQLQKALHKQLLENNCIMQGTIPYLGTFLTDLTMIDTALPDLLPNGLINFDKRRKEFEVLAQIKLLQSASNNYCISQDKQFQAWFYSISILDDTESYELSCLIEPSEYATNDKKNVLQKFKSSTPKSEHRKKDSTSSSTSSSCSQFYDHINNDNIDSFSIKHTTRDKLSKSCSNLFSQVSNNAKSNSQEFYIAKVSLEGNYKETKGINLYKSIILSNKDHTQTVITNALLKHGITDNPDKYILAQLVPGGEIIFPNSANVFYAVNTAYDLNFVLKIRRENEHIVKRNKTQIIKRFLNSAS